MGRPLDDAGGPPGPAAESFEDAADRVGDLPPATLSQARALRDGLARLLSRERSAAAAFLAALVDFDTRRGWEPLGHASLFMFLHRELGLSKGAAYLRFTAVRLVRRFPEVAAALESGRLCLSAVGEVARVMTSENRETVLPRFYGCSSREAREVAAALAPREAPPFREVVTRLPLVTGRRSRAGGAADLTVPGTLRAEGPEGAVGQAFGREAELDAELEAEPRGVAAPGGAAHGAPMGEASPLAGAHAVAGPLESSVRAHELAMTRPRRGQSGPEFEPLDADLRRLHLTVSRTLLSKLEAARDGLSHVLPGATTEQVLEAALDLLLEKQARAWKLARGARAGRGGRGRSRGTPASAAAREAHAEAVPGRGAQATSGTRAGAKAGDGERVGARGEAEREASAGDRTAAEPGGRASPPEERHPAADGPRRSARAIPAAVERAVRLRDGGRCQFPIDAGGVCGSTTRVQLDHVIPVALGGQATLENLRLLCAGHNRYAARLTLGEGVMAAAQRRRRGRRGKGSS